MRSCALRLDNRDVLFELDGVSLARAGRHVLRSLDGEIPAGATCVVGPSGSGKSTLLRLLNRLVDPDRGCVSLRGADVRGRDALALRREVCLVPQLPALLPGTVEQNLGFAAGLDGAEADVARLLALSGLDPSYASRDASQLSVGEQQRAMLARALAVEPRVLLLDEPTAALDPAARDAIEATLLRLRRELGVDLVIVTHDHEQARRLAQWTVRMDAGTVLGAGPTHELAPA